jgi:hypothetical protein
MTPDEMARLANKIRIEEHLSDKEFMTVASWFKFYSDFNARQKKFASRMLESMMNINKGATP